MNIYQGRAGLAALILLAAQCFFSASAADDMMAPLFDCSASQLSMVSGSNQALMAAEGVSEKDLRIEAEEQGGKIALHLYDRRKTQTPETPGAGDLGWVTYDPQNNSLTDVNDSPLTFNQEAGKRYQQCLQRAKKCQSLFSRLKLDAIMVESPRWVVKGKSRAGFYSAPVEQCRSESVFVIPGDIVQVVGLGVRDEASQRLLDKEAGDEQSGYLLVQFRDVMGWVRADRLDSVDDICDDALRQANVSTWPESNFSPRRVANHRQRLYFYDAPNGVCAREDKTFIVDGDSVQALSEKSFAGFTFVRYVHPVTHEVTEGWVLASGLK
ncbi:hypothetical protein SOASR030_26640 [Leminorella grimontii]|uniref:SH3 domain-containing protein n=1 Tax=Leminorella grimontii TaxID=82981 RepID=A0AAV5N880_9GAMM|nr:hypothetical protein [Leminorella grimontii]KFC94808.1 hypothetical protein GLGR_2569 [Leminorella grimontii ATCC 33999 = DSM 5078]GKX56552.1 hypothetical protein SOASR030_26640 [Leminorella grimontii]VFS61626.1 Uncharacterised protein [Leminorella grimontii]